MKKPRVIGVIPSRYASVRLPAKPLVRIAGKPLVQRVWEAASRAVTLDEVHVATDDERIAQVVREFGGSAIMTSVECASGTDRIAQAMAGHDADIVVNVQGDEPLMDPSTIDSCVRALLDDAEADVSTPMIEIRDEADYLAPHVVKVVYNSKGHALYFSRAPIPDVSRLSAEQRAVSSPPMKHLGLYVYRRDALERFTRMPPSRYEQLEKLEQLRFLEAGVRIRMVKVVHDSVGVDTPQDVATVEALLAQKPA